MSPGGSEQSRYTILHRLASGGMAEVYLGQMLAVSGVRKQVVIKRILPELANDDDFVRMFLDEARVAATLQHPNIVQTHDVVEGSDGYFIVMEYLVGADVRTIGRALSKSDGRFPVDIAVQILVGVLAGLQYAHERRDHDGVPLEIVHRDVSPHNTFLTYDGAVKVVDFGVAKAANNANRTHDGAIKGKVRYLSPEHCVGAELDRRSDLYSAGVMLYEMLTHSRVHSGENPFATMRLIVNDPVLPPRDVNPELPEELAEIVMRSLEKKRSKRYQSAQEFQGALESFCSTHGIFLSPIRLGAWVRDRVPPQLGEVVNTSPTVVPEVRSTPHAEIRSEGGMTIVTFAGRLDESFDGVAIGSQLSGDVIFDLDGVRQITSFGIRSWLEMIRACEEGLGQLYFVRCRESFLNQASMVRALLQRGKICSFYVPFLCAEDQREFSVLVDGAAAMAVVHSGQAPQVPCPVDASHRPQMDDDPSFYAAFRGDLLASTPRRVAKIFSADGDGQTREVIKELDGDMVRIRVLRELDGSTPWRRMLDGLEGEVTLDLRGATGVTSKGVDNLVKSLERAAEDLEVLRLKDVPIPMWSAVHGSVHLRSCARLVSVQVHAACKEPMCGAYGVERIGYALAPGGRHHGFEMSVCRTCNGELSPLAGALEQVRGFAASVPLPVAAASGAPPVLPEVLEVPRRGVWAYLRGLFQ